MAERDDVAALRITFWRWLNIGDIIIDGDDIFGNASEREFIIALAARHAQVARDVFLASIYHQSCCRTASMIPLSLDLLHTWIGF
jgi:hypothetical protein